MSELKRCPFCGGEAKVETRFEEWDGRLYDVVYVFCTVCGCKSKDVMFEYKGLEDAKQKVIAAWNNRKPVEDVLERMEKKIQPLHNVNWNAAMEEAIRIIKEELGGE